MNLNWLLNKKKLVIDVILLDLLSTRSKNVMIFLNRGRWEIFFIAIIFIFFKNYANKNYYIFVCFYHLNFRPRLLLKNHEHFTQRLSQFYDIPFYGWLTLKSNNLSPATWVIMVLNFLCYFLVTYTNKIFCYWLTSGEFIIKVVLPLSL